MTYATMTYLKILMTYLMTYAYVINVCHERFWTVKKSDFICHGGMGGISLVYVMHVCHETYMSLNMSLTHNWFLYVIEYVMASLCHKCMSLMLRICHMCMSWSNILWYVINVCHRNISRWCCAWHIEWHIFMTYLDDILETSWEYVMNVVKLS